MNTRQPITQIDHIERRGRLAYWVTFDRIRIVEGHFMLATNNRTVTMRKIKGRRRFQLTNIENVESFTTNSTNTHN